MAKNGGFRSRIAKVGLANENRIITALALDASSETRVVASMLDQSARVTGAQAEEVLLDAGYFDDEVIEATLARDVSLLCPEGQWPSVPREDGLFIRAPLNTMRKPTRIAVRPGKL
jgi:hypothetical protein